MKHCTAINELSNLYSNDGPQRNDTTLFEIRISFDG